MTFIDLSFLVFLLATFIVFYICPVKFRWIILLLASIVFYVIAGVKFLPFITFTTLTIYLAGRKMGKRYEKMNEDLKAEGLDKNAKKEIKETAKKNCKKYMVIALIINLILLCVIKFTKFAVDPINDLLKLMGTDKTFKLSYIIVPLGVSYYTFSCISYLLDVYWKRVDYEKNFARFFLYAIYFPHILQGPIERYGKLGQRLKAELRFDYDRVCKGIQLMIWGFFKKLVIADRINIWTTAVYADGSKAAGVLYIIAFLLDVVYIYADFSGCMDIARGASQIFGVDMDLNFDHPFASKSVTEFWRHWHMSLGSWFKDYVYYPISTSRFTKNLTRKLKDKKVPDMLTRGLVTFTPVFVTWLSTGIWHGTGITYVCWGLYYAVMIFLSVMFGDKAHNLAVKMKINTECWSYRAFQMVRTTLIFAGGRLLTRPGTLKLSMHALKSSFTRHNYWVLFDDSLYNYGLDGKNFRLMIVSILIFGAVSAFQMRQPVREWLGKQNMAFRWCVCLAGVFAVLIFGIYGVGYNAAAFVYMGY